MPKDTFRRDLMPSSLQIWSLLLPVPQPAAKNKTDFEARSIINLRLITVREREKEINPFS